jgi:hypothetical protein
MQQELYNNSKNIGNSSVHSRKQETTGTSEDARIGSSSRTDVNNSGLAIKTRGAGSSKNHSNS